MWSVSNACEAASLLSRVFLLGPDKPVLERSRISCMTLGPPKVNAIYCISSTLGGQRTEVYPLGRRWGSKGQPRGHPGGPRGGASGSQERPLGVQGASKRAPGVPKEAPGASRGGPSEPWGCPQAGAGPSQNLAPGKIITQPNLSTRPAPHQKGCPAKSKYHS